MIDKLNKEIKNIVRENLKGYILIAVTFLSGMVLSRILNFSENNDVEMSLYLNDFVSNVKNYSTDSLKTFQNAMSGYFRYTAIVFLMSVCMFGYFGVLAYVFFKGFCYGTVIFALFNLSFFKGISFFISVILPHAVIVAPCCVCYSFMCIKNSFEISKGTKGIKSAFAKPLLYSVVALAVMSTGALVQAYVEPLFIRLINFN